MRYLFFVLFILKVVVDSFRMGGRFMPQTRKSILFCTVSEAMEKADKLLKNVSKENIPTVVALSIMKYETERVKERESQAKLLSQEKEAQSKMLGFRRSYYEKRLSFIVQRVALEYLFTAVVEKMRDNDIQTKLKTVVQRDTWKLVEELTNPKTKFPSMTMINKILLDQKVRNILWPAINFPCSVEVFPMFREDLLYGALSYILHNADLNILLVSNSTGKQLSSFWQSVASWKSIPFKTFSDEDAGIGEELENSDFDPPVNTEASQKNTSLEAK